MNQEEQGFVNAELLARLDFLNLEVGLKRCMDDEDFYLEVLASFVEENKLAAIKSIYMESNWPKYRIKVHALKTSAAYIGAEELAAWAKQLEMAAKDGDEEFIHSNHYPFIDYYEGMLRQIDSALSLKNNNNNRQFERPGILVVDADAACQESIRQILMDQFQVDAVANAAQLFAYLAEKERPDVILLDFGKEGQDNHEVLRELKRNKDFMDIPVAIMVPEQVQESALQGISEGAAEYLIKPLHVEILMMRITRMLKLSKLQTNLQRGMHMITKAGEEKNQYTVAVLTQLAGALMRAIGAKSRAVRAHSERVARYAVLIAQKLGCDEKEITAVRYAALLHDIGKIGIPDELIKKTGSLTAKELEVVRTHPVLGADILQGITAIPEAYEAARWHHEWYDGTGYPDGRQGRDIPDLVRLISVADAYDTMTSVNSLTSASNCRGCMTQAEVRAEIEQGIGRQFDPVFANIMLDIIDGDRAFALKDVKDAKDTRDAKDVKEVKELKER